MTIDFEPSDLQRSLRDAVTKICTHFDDDYWLQCDRDGKFPHEFHKELASGGWLGICISEAYGGSGLGITEAAIMMEPIGASSRREIEKMGRKAVDSNLLFIDGLEVPVEDRIGEEGRGFEYILHGMNPERILIAAEAIGLGRAALRRATSYANERIVFGRPIGQNQAIQHPLAECWMELEAADLMMLKAAWQYDQGIACGPAANAAKYLAAEAGFKACQTAIATHGGYGYAKEYHVERYLREVMIAKLAPVSPQLVLCFIAEKVLGLPKSY